MPSFPLAVYVIVIGALVWSALAVAIAFLHYLWRSRGGRYQPVRDKASRQRRRTSRSRRSAA